MRRLSTNLSAQEELAAMLVTAAGLSNSSTQTKMASSLTLTSFRSFCHAMIMFLEIWFKEDPLTAQVDSILYPMSLSPNFWSYSNTNQIASDEFLLSKRSLSTAMISQLQLHSAPLIDTKKVQSTSPTLSNFSRTLATTLWRMKCLLSSVAWTLMEMLASATMSLLISLNQNGRVKVP